MLKLKIWGFVIHSKWLPVFDYFNFKQLVCFDMQKMHGLNDLITKEVFFWLDCAKDLIKVKEINYSFWLSYLAFV